MRRTFSNPRGFTLIELLVVIAIVGILSSLSVVSIGSARGRARTTSAKTAISGGGRGIEACRDDLNGIISNVPGAGADTLTSSSGTLNSVFTGTCSAAGFTYPTRIEKVPSPAYTYTYTVGDTPASGVRGILPGAGYLLYSNLPDESGYFVTSVEGSRTSASNPAAVTVSVRPCSMGSGGTSNAVEFRQGGTLVASTSIGWPGTQGTVSLVPGTYSVRVLGVAMSIFYVNATSSGATYSCTGALGLVSGGTDYSITVSSTANVIGIVAPPY